eukprot:8812256-Karenia_brevis.AAC.1
MPREARMLINHSIRETLVPENRVQKRVANMSKLSAAAVSVPPGGRNVEKWNAVMETGASGNAQNEAKTESN